VKDWLLNSLIPFARDLPLEGLIFIYSFIEEISIIIPTFPLMTMFGSLARMQEYSIFGIIILGVISATGRLAGFWLIYHAIDKLEDVAVTKFGHLIGLNPGKLENYGQELNKSKATFLYMIVIYATPFTPSTAVTLVAGLIRINEITFLTAAYTGTIIRNTIYLYVGYYGLSAVKGYFMGADSIEFKLATILVFVAIGILIYSRQRARSQDSD
jgi:membrane protein DedA with SNARE-associated domain